MSLWERSDEESPPMTTKFVYIRINCHPGFTAAYRDLARRARNTGALLCGDCRYNLDKLVFMQATSEVLAVFACGPDQTCSRRERPTGQRYDRIGTNRRGT